MYNEYEEYMRSVLGYNSNQENTYIGNDNYSAGMRMNTNMQDVNKLYPEIYLKVYPLVQKMCSKAVNVPVNENIISQMVNEIYNIVEPENEAQDTVENMRNGDVRNPRARETRRPPKRDNRLLRDLIRILILRELFGDRNNQNQPPRPNFGGGPIPPLFTYGNPKIF